MGFKEQYTCECWLRTTVVGQIDFRIVGGVLITIAGKFGSLFISREVNVSIHKIPLLWTVIWKVPPNISWCRIGIEWMFVN